MRYRLLTAASLALLAACSGSPSAPEGAIEFEIGLLSGGVLQDSVVVHPGQGSVFVDVTMILHNRGDEGFRYSGTMRSTFQAGVEVMTRSEPRAFEVLPGERKNIGTVELAIVKDEEVTVRNVLTVEFMRQSAIAPAHFVVVVP